MPILARPSPNFNERVGGAVDMLVLHYTGMISREHAMARLCDPKSRVSAHYLIDEAGRVYQMVAEAHRAWHAGVSFWAGETDINSRSIGIELVNPGHDLDYRIFPQRQMEALAQLCLQIMSRHPVPASRVLGHSDVAPGRKCDPGEKFDWAWLSRQGVGAWPIQAPFNATLPLDILELQQCLARFGYDIPQTGIYGTQTRAVVTAFQRHFRPDRVDGAADAHCLAILRQLLS